MSRGRIVMALLVLVLVVVAGVVYADCYSYYDSRHVVIQGQHVCALSGSACVQCVSPDGTISCVGDIDDEPGDLHCSVFIKPE